MSKYTEYITNPKAWVKRALKTAKEFVPASKKEKREMDKTISMLEELESKTAWGENEDTLTLICAVRLESDMKWHYTKQV